MSENARLCFVLPVLAAFPLVGDAALAAGDPGKPGLDHYALYEVEGPLTEINEVVTFQGVQYDSVDAMVTNRREVLVPAQQDGSAYVDSTRHLTSWWIFKTTPERTVHVFNKFDAKAQQLTIKDAVRVLLPASKFPVGGDPAPIPDGINHYLCYKVTAGDPINQEIILADQFGTDTLTVTDPKWFCIPAVKKRAGEEPTPIFNQWNLACYGLTGFPTKGQRWFMDQFMSAIERLSSLDCVCVPSAKGVTVSVERSTWGRIKAIYR